MVLWISLAEHMPSLPSWRKPSWTSAGGLVAATVLLLVASWLIDRIYGAPSGAVDAAMHTFSGTCAIVVYVLVFVVAYNWRRHHDNPEITLLGSAFLCAAIVESLQIIGIEGLAANSTPTDTSRETVFWLAARLLTSATLAWVAWSPWRRSNAAIRNSWAALPFAYVLAVTALVWFRADWFSALIAADGGSTAVSRAVEGLIIALCLAAAGGLYRQSTEPGLRASAGASFDPYTLLTAAAAMALAGPFFIVSLHPGGLTDSVGHAYQIGALWFVYRGLVAIPGHVLHDAAHRAEIALAGGNMGLWTLDLATNTITLDARAAATWGMPPIQECEASRLEALLHQDDRSDRLEAQRQALEPEGAGHYEAEYRMIATITAPERWVVERGQPQFINGRALRMIGTVRDITSRKRAEELLTRGNERLEAEVLQRTRQVEAMYDAAVNAILTIDPRGTIQSINAATTRLLGYERDELIGSNIRIIMPEPYASHHDAYLESYRATGQRKIIGIGREVTARRKDGTTFPIHLSVSEFEVNDKRFFTGIITDLTDRQAAELALRETERQLAQAQKMEAVGQLTGGLAHDFNNLLTVISGNLELLGMRIDGEVERDLLHRAEEGVRMGARLTSRLMTFSSRRALQPTVVNLNDTTVGMTELLRRTLGEAISVTSELAPDLWNASVDASEIENAILNLAINARDAMPNGGRILIETANVEFGDDEPGPPDSPPGPYVKLSVSDDGSGMTPEVVARAFEPFFTTKGPGRGTGLGLSMIYGFIRQSHGRATIYSEPGKGTTVSLYLPRDTSGRAAKTVDEADPANPSSSGETILVVEDNEQVRHLTVTRLHALGYQVLVAEDGASALRLLEQHAEIELVFSDVVMPGGMSGFDVLRWTKQNKPNVKVLLTSGFAPEMANNGEAVDPGTLLLRKPYAQADLARAIREALHT